jgi:hypothetical protein
MRASPRSWRARASRSMRSTSTRWTTPRWSTSSARRRTPACSAPMRCGTAWTCRGGRCACWSSTACPGRGPPSCTGNGGRTCRRAGPRRMTTPSRATGCGRPSGGSSDARMTRACSCCSTAPAPPACWRGCRGRGGAAPRPAGRGGGDACIPW